MFGVQALTRDAPKHMVSPGAAWLPSSAGDGLNTCGRLVMAALLFSYDCRRKKHVMETKIISTLQREITTSGKG